MNKLVSLSSCSFTAQEKTILAPQSFDIHQGDCLRIAGSNGAGKTTLLRIIKGEINPDGGIGSSRIYHFGGETSSSPIHAKKHVRLVSPAAQNLYRQRGWNITGYECVATGFDDSPLLYRDLESAEKNKIEETLEWLGFSHLASKSMIRMSRGEGRKILMARALVSTPALVLLDEFMHELDPSARAEISHALTKAHDEGVSIVYTTHIDAEILPMTTGSVSLAVKEPHRGMDTGGLPVKIIIQDEVRYYLKKCSIYRENVLVIRSLDLQIKNGENWVFVGSNGAGKSTLLKTLSGELRPAIGGYISRMGIEDGEPIEPVLHKTGLVSSDLQCVYDGDTPCEEVVASGFFASVGVYEEVPDEYTVKAREMLSILGLDDFCGRIFSSLSYGEQRKVILARAIVNSPEILLLDEPFAGVDAASKIFIKKMLESLSGRGYSFVAAVHHYEDIPCTATHLLHLENGIALYKGRISEYPAESVLSGI